MENEILNEIPANEQWNIWWNKCHGEWNIEWIPTNEQWNIQWDNCHGERNIEWNTYQWAMKYLMKYLPMSNEISAME